MLVIYKMKKLLIQPMNNDVHEITGCTTFFSSHDGSQKMSPGGQNIDPPEFQVVTARYIRTHKHHHTYFAGVLCCSVLLH
jgi:hypothetical protein